MVIKNVILETVCGITSKIPENQLPEIAFAGKSNVGKSSLINALMNRRSLARTSSRPGKTQTINFYNINGDLYLVDLPGYGYASASEEIRAKWGQMIENYLHVSRQLAAVFLLIDLRHAPSDNDRLMYEWMVAQGYSPIVIATKLDKLNRSQIPAHMRAVREGLGVSPETVVIPFSAVTKQGREEIWALMERLAGGETRPEEETGKECVSRDLKVVEDAESEPRLMNTGDAAAETAEAAESAVKSGERTRERKPRWKSVGRTSAKKTERNRRRRRGG